MNALGMLYRFAVSSIEATTMLIHEFHINLGEVKILTIVRAKRRDDRNSKKTTGLTESGECQDDPENTLRQQQRHSCLQLPVPHPPGWWRQ